MIVLSVLLAVGAVLFGRKLAPRWGNWNATVTALATFTAAVAAAMIFLPGPGQLPERFPADVLWEFRLASIGIQALLWAALGLILGALAERLLEPRPAKRRAEADSALGRTSSPAR
jgi:hypothetical protein